MLCNKCGNNLELNAQYCPKCGNTFLGSNQNNYANSVNIVEQTTPVYQNQATERLDFETVQQINQMAQQNPNVTNVNGYQNQATERLDFETVQQINQMAQPNPNVTNTDGYQNQATERLDFETVQQINQMAQPNPNVTNIDGYQNQATERLDFETVQQINQMASTPIVQNIYSNNQMNIPTNNSNVKPPKKNELGLNLSILLVSGIIIFFSVMIFNKDDFGYYTAKFSNITEEEKESIEEDGKTSVDVSKYVSKYYDNETDYKNAVQKISNLEKEKCSKLSTLKYENEIIEKYKLYSVNLCELSDEYLKQILKIYEYAEKEYPGIFDYAYATQILYDADTRYAISNNFSGAIALYGMIESFNGEEGSNNRLGMLLNTNYFLNETYFEQIMKRNVNSKHFPSNATIYSPVIHELGHKLHFDLVFKKNNFDNFSIVDNKEYDNYVKVIQDISGKVTTTKIVEDAIKEVYNVSTVDDLAKYTAEISNYAKSDPNEAIAEAVHDYYLNGKDAHKLSIGIVKVLKEERANYFG